MANKKITTKEYNRKVAKLSAKIEISVKAFEAGKRNLN